MTKAAIPSVKTGRPELDRALSSIKQNLDAITAQSKNVTRLTPLAPTATLAEVITQLNAIVDRLQ
jgi:hypothetical protein